MICLEVTRQGSYPAVFLLREITQGLAVGFTLLMVLSNQHHRQEQMKNIAQFLSKTV